MSNEMRETASKQWGFKKVLFSTVERLYAALETPHGV